MKYEVRCECGKAHAVTAADAGASLSCPCGRTVDVPPFHMLRTARGTSAVSPLAQVRSALMNGLLPGTRACAVCGTESEGQCRVKVVYDRVPNRSGPSKAEVVGCLLAPCIGWLLALFIVLGLRANRESAGDEEAVVVPVPVCDACRPQLNDPVALRRAVRNVPDYAALLDHYPGAETTLFG